MNQQGFTSDFVDLQIRVGTTDGQLHNDFGYTDVHGVLHLSFARALTDGLSIPRFLWRVFGPPMRSKWLAAGIIHDEICKKAEELARAGKLKEALKLRLMGDDLFYEMLRFLGSGKLLARTMRRGVRIGSVTLRRIKVDK